MSLTRLQHGLRCLFRRTTAAVALLIAVEVAGCRSQGPVVGPAVAEPSGPPASASSCTSSAAPEGAEVLYRPELAGCAVILDKPDSMPKATMDSAEVRRRFDWIRTLPNVRELRIVSRYIPLPAVELPELRRLDLSSDASRDLHALKQMPRLEHLEVHIYDHDCPDLAIIGELSQLRELAVTGATCKSLAPLGRLGKLERLDLSLVTTHDLGVLRGMVRLREFEIEYSNLVDRRIEAPGLLGLKISATDENDRPLDLADISGLYTLESLELTGVGAVKNAHLLSDCSRLRRLTVQPYGAPEVVDYASSLPALEYLDVSNSIEIGGNNALIGVIVNLPALRHLVIKERNLVAIEHWLCRERVLERLEVFKDLHPREDRALDAVRACRPDLEIVTHEHPGGRGRQVSRAAAPVLSGR